jgi:hypothetical protein
MRNRLIALAAVAVLLPSLDWAACAILRHRMRTEYAAWTAAITSQGWTVHADKLREDGFPTGATLTIKNLDLAGGRAMLPGGLDWRASRVVLSLGLLHFWRLDVEPQGEQTIRVAGAKAVVFSADSLTASVPLGRGRADSIDLTADGLSAGMLASRQRQDVHIDHLALLLRADRGGAARIAAEARIDASGIALPDNGRWPLGATVRNAAATIELASPALSGVAAAEQARAWRDWGGALTIQALSLRWGPLDLHAQAKLDLDDRLQPAGAGTATVQGWAQTVDALAAGGSLPNGMADTVKMVMGLMARTPADAANDGQATLSLPFTLKDSTLSVGKIPLIRLHSVDWSSV